jgi:hypothetical protein
MPEMNPLFPDRLAGMRKKMGRPKPKQTSKPKFHELNREEMDTKLREKYGDEWVENNKKMLDDQWAFIESM